MNRLRNLGILAIVAVACGLFAAGCSGNEDLKPVPKDPGLAGQEQRPGDKGMAGEEGGSPKTGG